jgi:hypothetical protein
VSTRARSRAAAAAVVALVAGIVLAGGQVTGAFALFTGETQNQSSTFSGGWIPAPSGASSATAGSPYSQVTLTWTSGSTTTMPNGNPNPVTGQTIQYANGGGGGSASCGSYGSFKTESAGTTSDSVTGSDIASWWCFQVYSTSAGPWTSAAVVFTPRRLFVPSAAVTLTDAGGGHVNFSENGDRIAIPYNQTPTNVASLAVQVCSNGSIYIGAAACSGTPSVGLITGMSINSTVSYPSSTGSVAGSTLTITLGGANNGVSGRTQVQGTGSFTSGSGVTSTGGQNACTASPTCSVSTSGDF